ncbi:MAG: 2-C-methyl-D-erythritol 4-phosphate cytidylyltransferase [Syntrophomonadaceae bacterium]|nr:2-C-methyl-D-erythritol 4-phosphate cytidylyltransferase [Bacillota bacterium]
MRVSAIIPAAGRGRRVGGNQNKLYLHIKGKPVIIHTLFALKAVAQITEIILVIAADEEGLCHRTLNKFHIKGIITTTGGENRQTSVANGLVRASDDSELILIHDGARPFVSLSIITKIINEAGLYGAAVTAIPITNTIKEGDEEGFVKSTLKRDRLWSVQTPQAFKSNLIKDAHRKAAADGFTGTDDAMLVERLGHPVKIVKGSSENIKITTSRDFIIAKEIFRGRN